jgi:signal transduction histidine kinase
MRSRGLSLRRRLTFTAIAGAAIALAILVSAFNVLLDARLRSDGDNVLRERAATVLRGLGTVDGRLSVVEAPDQGAVDAQTWIFTGGHTLEQPAGGDVRNQEAALALANASPGFASINATDTRLYAVPASTGGQPLGTVVVGASLAPYESTASSALLGSITLGLLVLAAVAALSLWLIGRALRPVAQMTVEAADWSEHDLSRRFYAGEPHDELTSLAAVFDGLLARVAQSLSREQRLTAEVSHELRTPLAKIQAEAELATSHERAPEQYRSSLQSIRANAEDLRRVLETLLASARAAVSTGPTTCDAREAAERAAAPFQAALAVQGKEIEVLCPRRAKVGVGADLVERILSPLIENATRFARHRITIEIRSADGDVVFGVRDDGPGVDPRDRERIFEPGFSRAGPRAGGNAGAGLGLPLARRLAEAAGGTVDAQDAESGGGFAVCLPTG